MGYQIFKTIIKLYDDNEGVDIVTLIEELRKKNILDKIGGPAYISELANGIPTAANVEHYARIVREKYILRSLISTSTRIISESYDSSAEVDGLLDRAEKMIFEITSAKKTGGRLVAIKDIVKESIAEIDKLNSTVGGNLFC